jgi:hypothetical protein
VFAFVIVTEICLIIEKFLKFKFLINFYFNTFIFYIIIIMGFDLKSGNLFLYGH